VLTVAGLTWMSRINYLFFHVLVELASVATAITLFSIGWHTRRISHNPALVVLAVGFLVMATLDLLHILCYKGMGIFPGISANPGTQFWIAARGIEAIAYLAAAGVVAVSHLRSGWVLTAFIAAGAALTVAIWPLEIFPDCLIEGQGLTRFKIGAEYTICALLALAAYLDWRARALFDRRLLNLLLAAIGLTILSELAFTLYSDVYGVMNLTGHLLKLASIVLVYRAIILGALRTPYQGLFRELAVSHAELDIELQQRRKIEQELRRANRDLDAFVRSASHDLRTPLTIITSGADLLRQNLVDIPNDLRDILKEISHQGLRMGDLLSDLLSLARLGEISEPPQSLAVEPVARRVIDDLAFELIASGSTVQIDTMPKVTAHPALLYQLLLNYIGNAVRYAAEGGPIEIDSRLKDGRVVLYVRDHGAGVVEHERDRIFDVFYRGAAGKEREGTGIGLATVRRIASLYGGNAWVEETPGGGATFCIDLPAG
jgi:signal transduction histidine kinase